MAFSIFCLLFAFDEGGFLVVKCLLARGLNWMDGSMTDKGRVAESDVMVSNQGGCSSR